MVCTVSIMKEDDVFVVRDIRTGVVDQGDTIEEALENLKEGLELYYEDYVPDDLQTPIMTTTLEVSV